MVPEQRNTKRTIMFVVFMFLGTGVMMSVVHADCVLGSAFVGEGLCEAYAPRAQGIIWGAAGLAFCIIAAVALEHDRRRR